MNTLYNKNPLNVNYTFTEAQHPQEGPLTAGEMKIQG